MLRTREITPPPIASARALLMAADAHDPEFGALLRVIAATGARRGEVCALRWPAIDFEGRTMLIRRSIASVPGGSIEKDTKTHAARRIAVDNETLAALARQRQRMEDRAAACALAFNPAGFVFTATADGAHPLHPDSISTGFRRLCARAGITGVRLHDLRHLHATQLLAAGVPVRTVSGRLGHANAATTLNVYAHFLEASDREAADVMGGLLAGPAMTAEEAIGMRGAHAIDGVPADVPPAGAANNPALLATLPDVGVDTTAILRDVQADRTDR